MEDELSPRQIEFLRLWLDPKSETFDNAYQSAIRAGYSDEYAQTLTTKGLVWLSESVGKKMKLIQKAERNLEALLDEEEDKKVKADMTKFTLSRLKKGEYSERNELTGPNGKAISLYLDCFPTP